MFIKTVQQFYRLNKTFNRSNDKYIYFAKIFLFGLLIYLYSQLFLLPLKQYFINNIPTLVEYKSDQNRQIFDVFLVLQTVLIAPIIEELCFRNLLTDNRNVLILCSILLCFFSPILTPIVVLSYFALKYLNQKSISHKSIFVVSALFAIVHIFNTPNILIDNPILIQTLFLIPLFLMPYFVIGYHLGIIKVNLGIKWAIAGHILYNLVFVVMSYIII